MIQDKKILVVDDEDVIVDILRRRFESMGFSVISSFDGREGIEILKREKIDLVVCDVKMPNGVTGQDVLHAAKKTNPDVSFVVISGHLFSDKCVEEMMQAGANLFIKKPFPSLKETTTQIADLI